MIRQHEPSMSYRGRGPACGAALLLMMCSVVSVEPLPAQDNALPKIEEMELPSAEELFKRCDPAKGRAVDWVVLKNNDVIVTNPVFPRPNTLEKMQAQIQASFQWPRPATDQEREEQRRRREDLNYVVIEIPDEPEYRLHIREIAEIVYHEDLMLRRIDALTQEGKIREAFEMLFILERSAGGWPGALDRQQNLMFRDAQLKNDQGSHEIALVMLEGLHGDNPDYAGVEPLMGQIADQLIKSAVDQEDFRKAQHFISRLRGQYPDHEVVKRWSTTLDQRAQTLFENAQAASQSGQHDVATSLVLESSRVWPISGARRGSYARIFDRFQRLVVAVTQLPNEPSAYFLPTFADRRQRLLTRADLFEMDRNDEVPHFQTRFFEQWEPADLGREVRFTLRQDQSYWESRPLITSSEIVTALAHRIDPSDPRYDERFDSYVSAMEVQSPFEFRIAFDRVPLRTEALFTFPILERADQHDPGSELQVLTRRFEVLSQNDDAVVYRRSVPEPDRVPVYHVAEVVEQKYSDYGKAVQAFLRRDAHVLTRVNPWDATAFKNDRRFFTQKYSVATNHVLQFNPDSKALQNRELRRALAYAINRQSILQETILRDKDMAFGRLATAPFPSQSYAHSPIVEQREYDLTLGLSLSIAAKHLLKGEIPRLRMICPPDPTAEAAARQMVEAWKRIRIDVELVPNDGSVVYEDSQSAEWDIVYRMVWMEEPLTELWPFLTLQPTARIKDLEHLPDWLRLELIELDSASSWPAAINQIRQLHRHLTEEVHLIPLWEVDEHIVVWKNLTGIADGPIHAYQNVEKWILKP